MALDPAAIPVPTVGIAGPLVPASPSAPSPIIAYGSYAAAGAAACYLLGGRPLYGVVAGIVGGVVATAAAGAVAGAPAVQGGLLGIGGALALAAATAKLYPGRRR